MLAQCTRMRGTCLVSVLDCPCSARVHICLRSGTVAARHSYALSSYINAHMLLATTKTSQVTAVCTINLFPFSHCHSHSFTRTISSSNHPSALACLLPSVHLVILWRASLPTASPESMG